MTRASPGVATMARISPSRKPAGSVNCPQWMKTLEEKYQKLHKKITENTMGNMRFGQSFGRSVHGVRLSYAVTRARDFSAQKNNSKTNPNSKENDTTVNKCVTNFNNETCDLQMLQDLKIKQDVEDQYLENSHTSESACEETEKGQINEQNKEHSPGNDLNIVLDTANNNIDSNEPNSEEDEVDSISNRGKTVENGDKNNNTHEDDGLIMTDRTVEKVFITHLLKKSVDKNIDTCAESKQQRRNVKTSLSRVSKVTTKSCPAKIQTQSAGIKSVHRPLLSSRSKSAHKNAKMFTPMSNEAKHAITETIHEMSLVPGEKKADIQFIPSRSRRCVKTWQTPKRAGQLGIAKNTYNAKTVLERASTCLNDLDDDGLRLISNHPNDADDCCHSSAGSSLDDAQKVTSRLPEIQNEQNIDHRSWTSQSYRLQGIGKYDIARGATFEITPPGFDSRYNDVNPVEERESETPPPDIRQKAIEKCSEWLVRYNKGS